MPVVQHKDVAAVADGSRIGRDEDRLIRLAATITRQRADLDALRARAAGDAVVHVAQGVLMERLSCSSIDAREQLLRLAEQSGTPLVELAADIINQPTDDVPGHRPPSAHPRRLRVAEAAVQIADDGADVAAALMIEGLSPLGAAAVALWTLQPDGALVLAGQAGLDALESSRWQRLPPQMDCLPRRVLRDGQARWVLAAGWPPTATGVPEGVLTGVPEDGRTPMIGGWNGAHAALPLVASGLLHGVMEVCWPGPLEVFTEPERRQLLALADITARTLRPGGAVSLKSRASWLAALIDGLLDSAVLADPLRDETGRIVDFDLDHVSARFRDPAGRRLTDLAGRRLLELYPLFAVPGGLFDRAVEVVTTGTPHHSDDLVVRFPPGGSADVNVRIAPLFGGVVITWRATDATDHLAALLTHAQRLGQFGGWQQDLITGDLRWTRETFAVFGSPPESAPLRLENLDPHVHPDDLATLHRFRDRLLAMGSEAAAAFRIVRPDGAVRQIRVFAEPITDPSGAVVAVRGAYQDVSAHYQAQVVLAATRDQLAHTEQRANDQRSIALSLQQAIMPASASPVDMAGLEVAVRYRPADQDHHVGGDWYDAVALPSAEILVVVGDVAGHGIRAVTGMVVLRNSLRGLAITGAGPAQLLAWLNTIAYHLTDNVTATVICGLYNPASRRLRWAQAGHLPPVLVSCRTPRTLLPPAGVLLGADPDSSYEEATTAMMPGDRLLLFTDGLIERRGTSLDDALAELLRLAVHDAPTIHQYADHILNHAVSDTDDDACLVGVDIQEEKPGPPL
ncbi:MAG: SpoIIE family protein phosphatase [Frankia sp.]